MNSLDFPIMRNLPPNAKTDSLFLSQFRTYISSLGVTPTTQYIYWDIAVMLGTDVDLASLDADGVRVMMHNWRNLSTQTVTVRRAVLRHLERWCKSTGRIQRDHVSLTDGPRSVPRLPRAVSMSDARKLIAAGHSKKEKAIIELLYGSGIRAGELCRLMIEDIDFNALLIKVRGKGGRDRVVPMSKPASAATLDWLGDRRVGPVFPGMARQRVYEVIKRIADRAGLRGLHPHRLRHSFATHLMVNGADLRAIQEMMGHADVDTTAIYLKVTIQDLKRTIKDFHPRGGLRLVGGQADGAAA